MSKVQWALVGVALLVLALLLHYVLDDSGSTTGESRSGEGDRDSLMEADAEDAEHVVGLKGAGERPVEAPTQPLPPPVDLKKVDRERDLHGIVVRADGAPVAGAALQTVFYPWRYGRLLTDGGHDVERLGPSVRSAHDGTFALRLRRGDHVHLRVSHVGLATTEYTMLQAGEFARIVLKEPVRLVVEALTPSGEPAAGLEMRIFRKGRGAIMFERTGTTGADGRFVFEDLPPGGAVFLEPQPRHEGWGHPGWISVSLPQAGEVTHEFTLPEGRTLRGTVTDKTTGKPITGARVGMNWTLTLETKTDAEGRYVLHGWSASGISDVHVLAAGYGREQVEVGVKEVLDFDLVPGNSAVGRVLRPDGTPFEGAQVMVVGSDRGGGVRRLSMAHDWTDKKGRFLLTGLSRDVAHVLTIIARGYAQGLGDVPAHPDDDEIDLGDITLRPARTLIGTVRSEAEEPLARIEVNLRIEEPGKSGYRRGRAWGRRSDDLGRFRFENLPPGTYTVSTRPDGGAGISKRVQVLDRDEPTVVTLVQSPGREVRIYVTKADGNPISGVFLLAQVEGAGRVQAQTGADGAGTLHLPPTPVMVQIYVEDRTLLPPKPITVAADETEATIVLQSAATTTGSLLDPSGKPLAGAAVQAERDGKNLAWARTDAAGRFQLKTEVGIVFALVFDGQFQEANHALVSLAMAARRDGVRAGSEDVVLRATATGADGSLRVRVVDPDGKGVGNVPIGLTPAPPNRGRLRTDAEGWAKIGCLPVRSTKVRLYFMSSREQPWLASEVKETVPEGQEIVFTLRKGALIEGTLLKADGTLAVGGMISVQVKGKTVGLALAERDGRFAAVVDPDVREPVTLSSIAHGPDGTTFVAVAKDLRPGDTGIVLRLERGN